MIALDTNVLLRFILQDDSAQAAQVRLLLQRECSVSHPAFISLVALSETIWVLRSTYKAEKSEILSALQMLINTRELLIEREEALLNAVQDYTQGNADFADYLLVHVAAEHRASPLYTFDRKLAKHPLTEWVG